MSDDVLTLFIRLVVVLPVILLLMFLVFKFGLSRKFAGTGGGTKSMRMLEYLPLGAKSALSLIEVGDKYYLIAHNENGFRLIKELDEPPRQLEGATPPSFPGILRNIIGGGGKQ